MADFPWAGSGEGNFMEVLLGALRVRFGLIPPPQMEIPNSKRCNCSLNRTIRDLFFHLRQI